MRTCSWGQLSPIISLFNGKQVVDNEMMETGKASAHHQRFIQKIQARY